MKKNVYTLQPVLFSSELSNAAASRALSAFQQCALEFKKSIEKPISAECELRISMIAAAFYVEKNAIRAYYDPTLKKEMRLVLETADKLKKRFENPKRGRQLQDIISHYSGRVRFGNAINMIQLVDDVDATIKTCKIYLGKFKKQPGRRPKHHIRDLAGSLSALWPEIFAISFVDNFAVANGRNGRSFVNFDAEALRRMMSAIDDRLSFSECQTAMKTKNAASPKTSRKST